MIISEELEKLEKYCRDYIDIEYRAENRKNNYIKSMRKSKNGLFIYGHKVYAPGYNLVYKVHTYIAWYESNNYEYINGLLDNFVLDCKRLREV